MLVHNIRINLGFQSGTEIYFNKMTEPRPEKPFRFDTMVKPVSQTDYAIWESTLWDFLKATPKYKIMLKKDLKWTLNEANHRGFTDDTEGDPKLKAEEKASILESILLKIGTYGPKSQFIDIAKRATSYKHIWEGIRRVCGFPVPGAQLIQYMCLKNSFDPSGTVTYNDHYWKLRDAKIASLMKKEDGVHFAGREIPQDEDITPSMENQVVADWLESIGGIKLIKYIGQEYAKELEKNSLYDLQEIIGQQEVMRTILDKMDNDEIAKLNRAQTQFRPRNNRSPEGYQRNSFTNKRNVQFEERNCYFCKELRNGKHKTHNTRDCYLRQKNRSSNQGAKPYHVPVSYTHLTLPTILLV